MPSALETAANRFRRELLDQERAAASQMVRAYGESWQAVRARIEALQRQIAETEAAGETVNAAWLFQRDRAQSLQAQIERELRRFADVADGSTIALQRQAVEAARRHSAELVDLAAGTRPVGVAVPFDVLPRDALQDLIGFAGDGSPLRVLYGEIGGGVAERVVDQFAAALTVGLGPRETARILRREFGTGLARALTIARTETLRAYREAAHRNYEANADVLEGWVWHAKLDTRTCAACWARHGTLYPLEERLNDHPNGRCAPVPRVKSWRALGVDIPDERPNITPGPVAFAKLKEADQRAILGKAAHAAYMDGALELKDMATERDSREWGRTLQRASLRQAVGAEVAARYTGR